MTVIVVLFLIAIVIAAIVATASDAERVLDEDKWQRAKDQLGDRGAQAMLDKMLHSGGRAVAKIPAIYNAADSKQYRFLQAQLLAAGGLYASSVEIYLATQVAGLILATLIASAFFFSGVSGAMLVAGTMLSALVAYYPYFKISDVVAKRRALIVKGLPDFAELLQMSLAGGMSILQALDFTAARLEGPVADEVRHLNRLIRSRTTNEREAFQMAAARLGTREADQFFAALAQSHLEGAKVIKNIERQAAELRIAAHQETRKEFKKLPTKLTIVMGVFYMPILIVLTLVPMLVSAGTVA